MNKLTFTLIGLIAFLNCFSQDSIVLKTVKKDSVSIAVSNVYYDIDLKISNANIELDSLYRAYPFKNYSVKRDLMASSKRIKDYLLDLIQNGGLDQKKDLSAPDFLYNFKWNNSTLSGELEAYIQSIHTLNLNNTVKRVAIDNMQKITDIKIVEGYTHKYNTPVTILKIQLYKIIWSEIYLIDNESVN